jgi:hypothetical protein
LFFTLGVLLKIKCSKCATSQSLWLLQFVSKDKLGPTRSSVSWLLFQAFFPMHVLDSYLKRWHPVLQTGQLPGVYCLWGNIPTRLRGKVIVLLVLSQTLRWEKRKIWKVKSSNGMDKTT